MYDPSPFMTEFFKALIASTVKPLLKAHGFRAQRAYFYQRTQDLIFLLHVQTSSGNTSDHARCYINCCIHSTTMDAVLGIPERQTPKESECFFRKRISAIVSSDRDGYTCTRDTDVTALSATITKDLKAVLRFFDAIQSTQDLVALMIRENGLNHYEALTGFLAATGDLESLKHFIKSLYDRFGTEGRWSLFEAKINTILQTHHRPETVAALRSE